MRVETVILRRNHILTILNLAGEAGVEISELAAAGATPLRLLKLTTAADRRQTFWRRVNAGLAATVVLLALGAAGTAYQQRASAYEALDARVTQAKTRALRLRKAQADAEAQFETNALLQREKARSPSLAGVWNALSETLPSGVWLTEMQISGRSGRISGFADSAAPLIEKLETLDQLSGVSFVSPVTMNPDDRSERFDISFTLETNDG
ncbi:PilN domain-containing protein [Breoghania sp. L-A4]|uniref:PilN domain-containing protein n=1 Tax=Breoghania sp. L-A4 TaxID=2304600 RepID=UPI0013C2EC4A|nr:PilN domain-containing protein [Breoghania sp. L-A4]